MHYLHLQLPNRAVQKIQRHSLWHSSFLAQNLGRKIKRLSIQEYNKNLYVPDFSQVIAQGKPYPTLAIISCQYYNLFFLDNANITTQEFHILSITLLAANNLEQA